MGLNVQYYEKQNKKVCKNKKLKENKTYIAYN